jgi:hypothetical protein
LPSAKRPIPSLLSSQSMETVRAAVNRRTLGDKTMRQFSTGEVVTCSLRYAAPGDYRIIAAMPDRDGDVMYKIKSPLEEFHRVVKESFLTKSQGHLLDEAPAQHPRWRSITLSRAAVM